MHEGQASQELNSSCKRTLERFVQVAQQHCSPSQVQEALITIQIQVFLIQFIITTSHPVEDNSYKTSPYTLWKLHLQYYILFIHIQV